jgi:hypothetical protein
MDLTTGVRDHQGRAGLDVHVVWIEAPTGRVTFLEDLARILLDFTDQIQELDRASLVRVAVNPEEREGHRVAAILDGDGLCSWTAARKGGRGEQTYSNRADEDGNRDGG